MICISAWLPCSFLGKGKKNPQWVTNYAWAVASSRRAEAFARQDGASTRGPEREPRSWVPAPNVPLVDLPISRMGARVKDTGTHRISQRAWPTPNSHTGMRKRHPFLKTLYKSSKTTREMVPSGAVHGTICAHTEWQSPKPPLHPPPLPPGVGLGSKSKYPEGGRGWAPPSPVQCFHWGRQRGPGPT